MLSFWEQQSFTTYDFAIIGSGIVGLSTAISLKQTFPKASVIILERGLIPAGASTKNAGFACFGSLTELLEDLKGMPENEMLALVTERYSGLQLLRNRLGDEAMDYKNYGGYELIGEKQLPALEKIGYINKLLKPHFKEPVFIEHKEKLALFGFGGSYKTMIYNPFEGQIDTGLMMKNLLKKARALDVQVMTGAEVEEISDNPDSVKLLIKNQPNYSIELTAKKVGCCTNAFTKKLLPDAELEPGRGLVLVTKPVDHLKFKGVFHIENGFYYFRNYKNRVIFGGGRNLDFETENSTAFEINKNILAHLKLELKNTILPHNQFEVDTCWTGIMAFGPTKQPILQSISARLFTGVRLGGMGVAMGSKLGERLANMML